MGAVWANQNGRTWPKRKRIGVSAALRPVPRDRGLFTLDSQMALVVVEANQTQELSVDEDISADDTVPASEFCEVRLTTKRAWDESIVQELPCARKARRYAEPCDKELPESFEDRAATVWHAGNPLGSGCAAAGHVLELLEHGGALVLVRFPIASTDGRVDASTLQNVELFCKANQWCWGKHARRPSRRVQEAAEASAYNPDKLYSSDDGNLVDWGSAPGGERLSVCKGARAWPPSFRRCVCAVAALHATVARARPTLHAESNEEIVRRLTAQLNQRGLTALVDVTILQLKRVPQRAWKNEVWPSDGDWSWRLRVAHTPEELEEHVECATSAIKPPSDNSHHHNQNDVSQVGGATSTAMVLFSPTPQARTRRPFVLARRIAAFARRGVTCFVCEHQATHAHPALRGKRLCRTCLRRYKSAVWCEDSDLLDLICGGCAFAEAAPHGCRSCGASLCERCLCLLRGSEALKAARRQRLHPELCPGCDQEEDLLAVYHVGKRVVCDACKQERRPYCDCLARLTCIGAQSQKEWHPRCHTPPLVTLPGLSTRWVCAECVLSGEPQTVAWSLRSCALCNAPPTSAVRTAARSWVRRVRLRLAGVDCSQLHRYCDHHRHIFNQHQHQKYHDHHYRHQEQQHHQGMPGWTQQGTGRQHTAKSASSFNHAAAIERLNNSIKRTNQRLSRSRRALTHAQLKAMAQAAACAGGLTVVSVCDGKGTLLGILLRAGLRIRRYLSVEIDAGCNRVCRNLYGGGWEGLEASALRFFSDARELTVSKLRALDCWPVHLLVGTTPCEDLSRCNSKAEGLRGAHSRLFVDFARFSQALSEENDRVPLAVLAENVVPTDPDDLIEMETVLRLPSLTSEAAVFEAARRARLIFANVRFQGVPADTPNVLLQSVLNASAVAMGPKSNCIITGSIAGHNDSVATARDHSQRNRGRTLVLCALHSTDVRYLLVPELARSLGQPSHEVDSAIGGDTHKRSMLGRSLAVGQIRHALKTFCDLVVEEQSQFESLKAAWMEPCSPHFDKNDW